MIVNLISDYRKRLNYYQQQFYNWWVFLTQNVINWYSLESLWGWKISLFGIFTTEISPQNFTLQ